MESTAEIKSEASNSNKEESADEVKDELSKVDEKKEGSDEEDIEEERSWRRGYSAE